MHSDVEVVAVVRGVVDDVAGVPVEGNQVEADHVEGDEADA
jgi:hypothetical protein